MAKTITGFSFGGTTRYSDGSTHNSSTSSSTPATPKTTTPKTTTPKTTTPKTITREEQIKSLVAQAEEARKRLDELKEKVASKDTKTETVEETKEEKLAELIKQKEEVEERLDDVKDRLEESKTEPEETEPELPTAKEIATLETRKINIGGVDFELPVELVNDPSFRAMDDMTKAMTANMWDVVVDQGQDIRRFIQALETAADQSDIYIGQHIRMFEDELAMGFTELGEDLEAQEKLVAKRMENLEKDLEMHKGDLTIDQQRELSKISKQYKNTLEETRNVMAERGLGRSSIKTRAEQKLTETKDDMVESTTIQYERAHRDLSIEAKRKTEDYQTGIEDIRKQTARGAGEIARRGEEMFGTDKMEQLLPQMGIKVGMQDWMPSDWMVGGVTATKEKQMRTEDITKRVGSLLGT